MEVLTESTTVFVRTSDSRLAGGIAERLLRWRRYSQVAVPDRADIILTADVTWENQVGGGRASAQLVDRATSKVVWAITKGSPFTEITAVGRQLVEELEKAVQAADARRRSR